MLKWNKFLFIRVILINLRFIQFVNNLMTILNGILNDILPLELVE